MAKSTAKSSGTPHEVQSGAVVRVLRPRRARPAEAARVTRAEINLAFVRHNLRELRECLKSDAEAAGREPAKLWPVLKADGYGHGATAVAATLEHAGVDGLCVALLEEGLELRESGIESPILVMGGYYGRFREGVDALLAHNLTPVVYEPGQIEGIANAARYLGREAVGVHLKVDTGMGRLGATAEQLDAALGALRRAPQLSLEGFMTHLACADGESLDETRKQLADFDALYQRVKRAGFSPRVRHAANSAAMLRLPSAQFDAVRPGIALFGVHPCPGLPSEGTRTPKLKPVMRVLTEIVALRDLPKGTAIGYGHTWRAPRPSKIATIPVGYADGLSRALSNRGDVLVAGKRCRIVGTVSMDLTMVDVTDVAGVSLRDEVVVLGQGRGRLGEDVITADEVAAKIGTISWECLTSVSRRVPRFYRHP